ncbi:Argininosuccinate synthase [Bienertia sinuspersici]
MDDVRMKSPIGHRLLLDKVSMVRGLFLTRFNSIEHCKKALIGEPQFFDYTPLIMKKRNPDIELHKENTTQFRAQILGIQCLHKLGDSIGTTLKVDQITLNRERLAYARILIELGLEEELTDHIYFQNEKEVSMQQPIEYELRKTYYTNYKRYGHPADKRDKWNGPAKKILKPKDDPPPQQQGMTKIRLTKELQPNTTSLSAD